MQHQKDLVLRDHTLKFIQAISMFIKYLNNNNGETTTPSNNNNKLDNELRDIVVSFESFVNAIDDSLVNDGSSSLTSCVVEEAATTKKRTDELERQLGDVEESLARMISEFRLNKIERVVSLALDVARSANEIFLDIAKSNI